MEIPCERFVLVLVVVLVLESDAVEDQHDDEHEDGVQNRFFGCALNAFVAVSP